MALSYEAQLQQIIRGSQALPEPIERVLGLPLRRLEELSVWLDARLEGSWLPVPDEVAIAVIPPLLDRPKQLRVAFCEHSRDGSCTGPHIHCPKCLNLEEPIIFYDRLCSDLDQNHLIRLRELAPDLEWLRRFGDHTVLDKSTRSNTGEWIYSVLESPGRFSPFAINSISIHRFSMIQPYAEHLGGSFENRFVAKIKIDELARDA